jgi:hypothetical protein
VINRRTVQCISCKSLTLTRTQIGHKDLQKHFFPCGTCGIEISFELELDQKNAGLRYRKLKNAKWIDSDPGRAEDHMVYLSDEILVPPGVPDMMSPFVAGFALYEDFEAYREDESQRQLLVHSVYDYLARCTVHFRKGNLALFDEEAKLGRKSHVTNSTRLESLYTAYTARFRFLTSNSDAQIQRVYDRIEAGIRREPQLMRAIVDELLSSGKMSCLATEIESVRRSMVQAYPILQPLFQLRYWKPEHQLVESLRLTDKRFDELQQLYVKCFETLCRLTTVALSIEAAITNGILEIAANRRYIRVAEVWQMSNAVKRRVFAGFTREDTPFLCLEDSD